MAHKIIQYPVFSFYMHNVGSSITFMHNVKFLDKTQCYIIKSEGVLNMFLRTRTEWREFKSQNTLSPFLFYGQPPAIKDTHEWTDYNTQSKDAIAKRNV